MAATSTNLRIEATAEWMLQQIEQAVEGDASSDFIVTRRRGDVLQVFVGDAAGHGSEGVEVAADARRLIERDADLPITVARLAAWNTELEPLHSSRFVCLTYIEIDLATRQARIANCGNPAVVVTRADGRVEQHDATGMPLGVVEPEMWHAPAFVEVELAEDDAILCVTDGVTEQSDPRRRRFGIEGVLATIRRATVDRVVALLDECLTAFAAGRRRDDDVTMLCISPRVRAAA